MRSGSQMTQNDQGVYSQISVIRSGGFQKLRYPFYTPTPVKDENTPKGM